MHEVKEVTVNMGRPCFLHLNVTMNIVTIDIDIEM